MNGTSFDILVTHPPAASPAMPSWACARFAACVAGPNRRVTQYDGNLDFFRRYCLDPKRLLGWLARIDQRRKAGHYEDVPVDQHRILDSLEENAPWWQNRMVLAGELPSKMSSALFYRPTTSVEVHRHLRDVLQIVSLAFFPTIIQWGRAALPQLNDDLATESLLDNPEANPFLDCYRSYMASHIHQADLNHVIITVTAPAQAYAGWTMARYVKHERPDVDITLFGPDHLITIARDDVDHVIEPGDDGALLALIDTMFPPALEAPLHFPDFGGFPLSDYLSPERVLPLDLVPEGPPLSEFCANLSRRYGAKAFYSQSYTLFDAVSETPLQRPLSESSAYRISLPCRVRPDVDVNRLASAKTAGLRHIRWHVAGSLERDTHELLHAAARHGIWNHVTLENGADEEVVLAAEPTTIHSWDHETSSDVAMAGTHRRPPKQIQGYRTVQSLPGKPFWQEISEPMPLFTILSRHPVQTIIRWRISDDPPMKIDLGSDLQYHYQPPAELPPGYLEEICRMVEAGGSVGVQWVRHNLERAFLIAYATEQGVIVANSSLKHPRQEYIEKLKVSSGIDGSNYLERGYTSVKPEYRGLGIGTRLLDGLTRRAGDRKIFSIIDEDNRATQKIAIRNRTRRVATFYSEQLKKKVGIRMPEWMIDECESES